MDNNVTNKGLDYYLNIEMANRVFQAIDELIEKGVVKNVNQFCIEADFPRPNFYRLKREPHMRVPVSVLHLLVNRYKVSAKWLITGKK